MIELTFTTTDEAFEIPLPPDEISAAVVLATLFEMPVSFLVNGVNLLGFPDGSTMQLALVGFAVHARMAVERAASGEIECVSIGSAGTLFMHNVDGKVRFWTTTLHPEAVERYEDAVVAFGAFSDNVQRVVESRVPEMRGHPQWQRLFPT